MTSGGLQGAASPVVARQSLADDGDSSTARPRGRSSLTMDSLAEDDMGSVTPMGASMTRESVIEHAEG